MSGKVMFDLEQPAFLRVSRSRLRNSFFVLAFFSLLATNLFFYRNGILSQQEAPIPKHLARAKARCAQLKRPPGPPPDFTRTRAVSDRFVSGTPATLIKNATIWTGRVDGLEVIHGDVLLDKGLVKAIGRVNVDELEVDEVVEIDANGAWVTSGIVDLHSHIGVGAVPQLSGAGDSNSRKGIAQPWLRSIDGLNTHDAAYELSRSGGVTTALVLPGSANDIGGQAFVIKLRETAQRTPTSMVVEPPFTLNATEDIDLTLNPRWRHMKHACGENPRRVYGNSRMDNIWAFRDIYDKARKIKEEQDSFCEKMETGHWIGLSEFPEELQYEALVDVLRGRVKVNVHCYETVDLDDLVRLTNEFKFPVAAFHHAHETYLVPDLLKQTYGQVPASAMFATNARYKREAYRGSEFASKILADNDIPVVMKSDHPVLNSRHLLFEAQQAHYYGLRANRALASVTSTPAQAMGMDHRIGFISENFDADIVIWDSHPLALGATPVQVFIDGVAQFANPHVVKKPSQFQEEPRTPDFSQEAAEVLEHDGLPPIAPETTQLGTVIFTNVSSVLVRDGAKSGVSSIKDGIASVFEAAPSSELGVAVIINGRLECAGLSETCSSYMQEGKNPLVIDLAGGALAPALVSYGSNLGLEEIQGEASTRDGVVFDALGGPGSSPSVVGGDESLVRAADGLVFATRHAYLAYRAGVTSGITAPMHNGFVSGVGARFSLDSELRLAEGVVVTDGGVHVNIGHGSVSISTQVASLRRALLNAIKSEGKSGDASEWFGAVVNGSTPLIVEAHSADVIATLIELKSEIEHASGNSSPLRVTISGASEAHVLAKELGESNVGIILNPVRQFPKSWEKRRILPGPPLTQDSTLSLLVTNNVTVGLGVDEPWEARNARFDLAWAALEANGALSKTQAIALASTNLEKLLGFDSSSSMTTGDEGTVKSDLVVTAYGDLFGFESKVVGIVSPRKGGVDLF